METLKSQLSFFCTLLNYRDGDWPQPVLLHQQVQSEYIDAFWIYCWNVTPSFHPKWGMLIFTGGTKSLPHWLNISARSHVHAFIHIRAFPLEQWPAAHSIPGKKGSGMAGSRPCAIFHRGQCHFSAASQDFASCKAACSQTPWNPGFNPRGIQKPLSLLEPLSFSWQKGTGSLVRSRGNAPGTSNLRSGQGEMLHCLWKLLLL